MSQQSVGVSARRSALDAQAALRKERADRERRLEALAVAVLTALTPQLVDAAVCPMCAPEHHDHDQDAHTAPQSRPQRAQLPTRRNLRNEKVRDSSLLSSTIVISKTSRTACLNLHAGIPGLGCLGFAH